MNMTGKMTWKIIYDTIMAKKMMIANVAINVKSRMKMKIFKMMMEHKIK